MPRRVSLFIWLFGYVATMVALLFGLRVAQRRVIASMSDPEKIAAWRAWAEETRQPPQSDQPVARRPVKSDEPPSLVLMRDHFLAVQGVTITIGSFLFGFLCFLGYGIWQQRDHPAGLRRDDR